MQGAGKNPSAQEVAVQQVLEINAEIGELLGKVAVATTEWTTKQKEAGDAFLAVTNLQTQIGRKIADLAAAKMLVIRENENIQTEQLTAIKRITEA